MEFAIIAIFFYFALLAITALRIFRLNVGTLCFADGMLVAAMFFVAIPLLLITISGGYQSSDLPAAAAYKPLEDLITTFNILLGWALILLVQYFWHLLYDKKLQVISQKTNNDSRLKRDGIVLAAVLVSSSLLTFILSGKAAGGNWMGNMRDSFSENVYLVLIANFANVYRTVVYGMLCYLVEMRKIARLHAALIGIAFVAFDIVISFNRITSAYFAIFLLLIYRDRIWLICAAAVPVLPVISFLSTLWGVLRSVALLNGFSLSSFESGLNLALNGYVLRSDAGSMAEQSNAIFETSSLQVFHNVILSVPNRIPVLWGWTYLLRPISIFIPANLWPDKPPTYSGILASTISDVKGLSLTSTMFGEPYGNFFYAWPIAFVAVMWFYCVIFHQMTKVRYYFGIWAFFCAFALGRFEMNFASIAVFAMLLFWGAVTVLNLAGNRKPANSFKLARRQQRAS